VAVALSRAGVIEHVVHKKKAFRDGFFFWRFTEHFMQHARFPPSTSESTVRDPMATTHASCSVTLISAWWRR
jgi:hypothetical protein